MSQQRDALASTLSLFGSVSTLVCCALPALFVALGAGATLAGLVGQMPWLVTLSAHKGAVFGTAAVLIALAGVMQWRGRNAPCPADPAKAKSCMRLRRFSLWVWVLSVGLFATGAFFAFVAPHLL